MIEISILLRKLHFMGENCNCSGNARFVLARVFRQSALKKEKERGREAQDNPSLFAQMSKQ